MTTNHFWTFLIKVCKLVSELLTLIWVVLVHYIFWIFNERSPAYPEDPGDKSGEPEFSNLCTQGYLHLPPLKWTINIITLAQNYPGSANDMGRCIWDKFSLRATECYEIHMLCVIRYSSIRHVFLIMITKV